MTDLSDVIPIRSGIQTRVVSSDHFDHSAEILTGLTPNTSVTNPSIGESPRSGIQNTISIAINISNAWKISGWSIVHIGTSEISSHSCSLIHAAFDKNIINGVHHDVSGRVLVGSTILVTDL